MHSIKLNRVTDLDPLKGPIHSSVSTKAWLLQIDEDYKIAIPENAFSEYVIKPSVYFVPGAVSYCQDVYYWRRHFLPLFDLRLLLSGTANTTEHIAVISYKNENHEKDKYLALKLYAQPEKILVHDESASSFSPDYPVILKPLVKSLFERDSSLVSIISLTDLCNEGYREYVAALQSAMSLSLS